MVYYPTVEALTHLFLPERQSFAPCLKASAIKGSAWARTLDNMSLPRIATSVFVHQTRRSRDTVVPVYSLALPAILPLTMLLTVDPPHAKRAQQGLNSRESSASQYSKYSQYCPKLVVCWLELPRVSPCLSLRAIRCKRIREGTEASCKHASQKGRSFCAFFVHSHRERIVSTVNSRSME